MRCSLAAGMLWDGDDSFAVYDERTCLLCDSDGRDVVRRAATVGEEIVVFVDHTSDAGERRSVFVPLDATGRPFGNDSELRIEHGSPYPGTIVATAGHALVALTKREEERFADRNELRQHDRPLLVDIGAPRRLRARTVGSWDDVDVAHIGASSLGDQTVWVMCVVSYPDGTPKPSLAYAYSRCGVDLPVLQNTDIGCTIVSHAIRAAEVVALLGTSQTLALWMLSLSEAPHRIVEVARSRSRTTITDARILRLIDGYALVWYVSAAGSGGSGGGLWARTCSTSLDDLDEPARLARDDDADWNEWRAFDVGTGALVLYGTGEAGDPVRQFHWRERRDVTHDAKSFPGRLPAAIATTGEGVVVITETFSDGGRRTTLASKCLSL